MKDGLRFVDCDMHIMEPVDLLDKYLDKKLDCDYCRSINLKYNNQIICIK